MTEAEKLGQKIKEAISKTPYSQREIAEKAGISENGLTNYIKGRRTPDALLLSKIAHLCDVSIDYFFEDRPKTFIDKVKEQHGIIRAGQVKDQQSIYYPGLTQEETELIRKLRQVPEARPILEKFLNGHLKAKEALKELENFNREGAQGVPPGSPAPDTE